MGGISGSVVSCPKVPRFIKELMVLERSLGKLGQSGSMLTIFLEGKRTAHTFEQQSSYLKNMEMECMFHVEKK